MRILVDRLVNVGIWRKRNRWISWSYDRIVDHFGSHKTWDRIRPDVLNSGLIDRHEHYKEGSQSMRYRLGEAWTIKPLIPHEIRNPKLISKIDSIRGDDRSNLRPIHYRLMNDLHRVRLDDSVRSVISEFPDTKRIHSMMLADMVQAFDHRFKVDRFNRAHTLVTSMPKPVRRKIVIDGKPTVEIDVSCCQPLLIGLYALRQANRNDWMLTGTSTEKEEGKEIPSSALPPIMSAQLSNNKNQSSIISDSGLIKYDSSLLEYIDVNASGYGYENIAEVTGMPYVTSEDRRKLKSNICHLIFGKKPTQGRPYFKQWNKFCDKYPVVGCAVDLLRQDDYRNVAHTLQRFESKLMIDGVCGSLAIERPDVPLLTVHDSIITTVDHAELVKERIGEVWERYGRRPRLKVS